MNGEEIMKSILMNYLKSICFILSFAILTGCDLDVSNPNSATEDDVLNSREGIQAAVLGMQGEFNEDVYADIVLNTGVTTREVAINTTFSSLIELELGGTALPPENSRTNSIWDGLTRIINIADEIRANAPEVIVDEGDLSGIIALTNVYKAMSLGYLVQSFEQAPINSGESAEFSSRQEVLTEAISLLTDALQRINSTPPSDNFNNNILLPGFDLENTINALLARYNLFAGNFQAAINAADEVDPTATSVFPYDGSVSRNPVFDNVVFGDEGQEYAPRDEFGSPLFEAGDEREGFYLIDLDELSAPNELSIDGLAGFFSSASSSIPVYLPGELNLIRAEAYVGLNQPGQAVAQIDIVRTKTASEDPFGLGANLPAYSGPTDDQSLLEEIYRQRSAELYLTGMRFEDARRLDRPTPPDNPPLTFERNRVYYPYPTQERQNNPNTPPDPAI